MIAAFRLLAARVEARHPILLKDTLLAAVSANAGRGSFLETLAGVGTNLGSLLCDGIGDAVLVQGEEAPGQIVCGSLTTSCRRRGRGFSRPTTWPVRAAGGRLFNLQSTTQKIRAATGHLKGVRIAVMGCIVNGPGEMADADFGYVGGAPGKINLYVGTRR